MLRLSQQFKRLALAIINTPSAGFALQREANLPLREADTELYSLLQEEV
jgi:hypothetical protein